MVENAISDGHTAVLYNQVKTRLPQPTDTGFTLFTGCKMYSIPILQKSPLKITTLRFATKEETKCDQQRWTLFFPSINIVLCAIHK